MPLTREQEVWLTNVEETRKTEDEERKKRAVDSAAADKKKKEDKKKGGDAKKDKDKKKDKKKSDDKPNAAEKPKSKYKSALHYMTKNFPTFDIGESAKLYAKQQLALATKQENSLNGAGGGTKSTYNLYNLTDIAEENYGPMRTMQMIECNRILDVCEDWGVPMDEGVLYRALIIPQDKPDALTIEQGLHDPVNGLMRNPLPPDKWRSCPDLAGGKKKKGGGKKKKK